MYASPPRPTTTSGSIGRRQNGSPMQLGLSQKLVTATLLVFVLLVGGVVAAIHVTFDADLSQYLRRVETEQIQPLTELLAEGYRRRSDWSFINRASWAAMVSRTLGEELAMQYPPQPPSPDVIGFMPRLSLVDVSGFIVVPTPFPLARQHVPHQWIEMPVTLDGKRIGTLRMLPTPVPARRINEQFRADQLHAFYLAALPGLLLSLLIAIPLGYHLVKPLRTLTDGIHALARGDYSRRLSGKRRDEMGQLTRDFNHLAHILERTEAQRREGMASVSHELRTPLAALVAAVDAMRDGLRPRDDMQLSALADNIDHLSHLVDDLYQLALADVGALVCRREPVGMEQLVDVAVDAALPRLSARGISVEKRLQAGVLCQGDAQRLRQVIDNLLENCNRYCEAGARITLSLRQDVDGVQFVVADSGPGVRDDMLDSLFERFYRGDFSRSRETGGAGLGLALVKAIVEAHGGTVTASHAPQGGLAISIELPRAQSAA